MYFKGCSGRDLRLLLNGRGYKLRRSVGSSRGSRKVDFLCMGKITAVKMKPTKCEVCAVIRGFTANTIQGQLLIGKFQTISFRCMLKKLLSEF